MKNIRVLVVCLLAMAVTSFTTYHFAAPKADYPVFNHNAFYVKNLQVSTRFYEQIIGLQKIEEPFHDGKHTWFAVGQGHVHIIEGAKTSVTRDKDAHFCLSVADFAAFRKRLDDNHQPYENWTGDKQAATKRVDGIEQLYLQDPDGYWLEINSDYPKEKN